ncbi:transcriptional regulator, TetR family [Streptomyces sp. yr375]|uniref:TetR/AcrR family transcriptional regulator n=1 Tax=Streptomyces sp. yr375 TaxID=1761906 RepID=UPI0008CCABF6|nr:TetR/AcrR family transcriptional regulator [Streptomyces sp. yr375]SEQ47358.1 transcriptional regulator, TetR family [Streptomyces sp. yr375]
MAGGEAPLAPQRRRSDARRNRETLLAAAREIYAERGVDAPLDDIARRAGVGNATLYRHFTDRAELIETVFHDVLAPIVAAARETRDRADAWHGLTAYLDHVFTLLAADRGAGDLMTTGIRGVPTLDTLREENRRTLETLLLRGQEQRTIRPDLTVEDLLFLLAALGRATPAAPGSWRRHLALMLDGLRPEAAHPLPEPPLGPEQFEAALHRLGTAPQASDRPEKSPRPPRSETPAS